MIEMKKRHEAIAALTAYDYPIAALLDDVGVDLILVGDSAAMVFSGYETTLPLTMDEAIYHCCAVRRAVKKALLVADMPFLSYQCSIGKAIRNAGRFFKEALVDAVKLEGGAHVVKTVRKLVLAGMPVMGHVGLTPQSVKQLGGYVTQAVEEEQAQQLLQDALLLQEAGCFAIVLEKIPYQVAQRVTNHLQIPTIGIGAGPYCDGQILVIHDILGLFESFRPRFARRFAELAPPIRTAVQQYISQVKTGGFPSLEESY